MHIQPIDRASYRPWYTGAVLVVLILSACAGGAPRTPAPSIPSTSTAPPIDILATPPPPSPNIRLHLAADGSLQLNGHPITLANLEAQLRHLRRRDPADPYVFILAPWSAPRRHLIQLMAIARRVGLIDLTIRPEGG